MDVELKKSIKACISNFDSADDIFELFKILNYPVGILLNKASKREKGSFNFRKEVNDKIINIYSVLTIGRKLNSFLIESNTISSSFIKSVTDSFGNVGYRDLLLIFSNPDNYSRVVFVFPVLKWINVGKHRFELNKLIIDKSEIIDKNEFYTIVDTLSKIYYEDEDSDNLIEKWTEAFSVERVTENYFEDYKNIFFTLRKELFEQDIPKKEAHEFSLQFLNRLMFIYFISQKKWLHYQKFIGWIWNSYKNLGKYGSNEFYNEWISQVFFKAFNNRSSEIENLPNDVIKIVSNFPYLNGNLFKKNDLDRIGILIDDSLFKKVFQFFEKYNFTIKENMPFDQEVAVDPQMIGYVYETLASISSKDVNIFTESEKKEDSESRKKWGIFYTHRVEVDFMCRMSIIEYLSKQLPSVPKEEFYNFVFDSQSDVQTFDYFVNNDLWDTLDKLLDDISVVDPSCGSGAFLVGMLNVLSDLCSKIYKMNNNSSSPFQIKKRIIRRSIYGVDVMEWAIHAAELRLWLQLIVETDLNKDELRQYPLLPNLDMNLRVGDSLIQDIGGLKFNVRKNNLNIELKDELKDLKVEKEKYSENASLCKFGTPEEIKNKESKLFLEIIDQRITNLREMISKNNRLLSLKTDKQSGLFGTAKIEIQTDLRQKNKKSEINKDIKNLKIEINGLNSIKKILREKGERKFIWEIDFAEIFGDKNGFDIVIGNPPYVQQELIAPPLKTKDEDFTTEEKIEYKEKLQESIKNQFHVIEKLDGRSDYYIYFYFHGLSLLNEKGTFCYITSNTWLDVKYGSDLQQFLLRYVPIHGIYDNPKKSFPHADINTIIALFGAPNLEEKRIAGTIKSSEKSKGKQLCHNAKFIMFKKPFEEVINPKNLIEIEKIRASNGKDIRELVKNVINGIDYRVFPVIQEDLLEDGWNYPEDTENTKRFKTGSYEGNKWGAKYLRAPEIFFTLLIKGTGKLIKLGEINSAKFGIKTGANDFFYLPNKYFDLIEKNDYYILKPKNEDLPQDLRIEKEFLRLFIKSPKENKSIQIKIENLTKMGFMCNKSKNELKNTSALKYIKWGETKGFNRRRTVSGRRFWWSLGEWKEPKIIIPCSINESFRVFNNNAHVFPDKRMYFSNPEDVNAYLLSVNSTLYALMQEINSRAGLGGGLLDLTVYEVNSTLVLNPLLLVDKEVPLEFFSRKILSIFDELGIDRLMDIYDQDPNPLPDRAIVDKIVFDALDLTENERKEIYWGVCELVRKRIEKSLS